jgi:hypothetical protein
MNISKDKYIKYKIKIGQLLKTMFQSGGSYKIKKHLGQGAESHVYDIDDGMVIKIFKVKNQNISENELQIYTQLNTLEDPHFVKMHAHGYCYSNDSEITKDLSGCETNQNPTEPMGYFYYQILDKLEGTDIITIFITWFKQWIEKETLTSAELVSDPLFETEKNNFAIYYLKIIKQMADALFVANSRGFRHVDCNYRNIMISGDKENPNPVFIDYGSSNLLGTPTDECNDIRFFMANLLRGTSFDRPPITTVFGVPEDVSIGPIKIKCATVLAEVNKNPIMINLKEKVMDQCNVHTRKTISLETIKGITDLLYSTHIIE